MNSYRRSWIIFAALSPFVGGAILNIATSLISLPEEMEIGFLIFSMAIVAAMSAIDYRQKSREEQAQSAKDREELERRERQERQEREAREERERQQAEERTLLHPIRVPDLVRKSGFGNHFGWRANSDPNYRAVESARELIEEEFYATCTQYGVDLAHSPLIGKDLSLYRAFKTATLEISEITGDGRWRIVGRNLRHLWDVGQGIYFVPGAGGSVAKYALVPDNESLATFLSGVSQVVAQLRLLREK